MSFDAKQPGRPSPRALLLLMVTLALFFAPPVARADPAHRTVRIEASQYHFTPGVIKVNRGDLVTIELVATDVVHGLYLDGYDLELTAEPGQTARLTFVAGRAGTYRFRCSVTCGAMHPFMVGKLRVGNDLLLWGGLAAALMAAAGVTPARKRS
jgi:heme/copper-type cytochrome/quinol oxidase subunit 2